MGNSNSTKLNPQEDISTKWNLLKEIPKKKIDIIWVDQNDTAENNKLNQKLEEQYLPKYQKFQTSQECLAYLQKLSQDARPIILTNATQGKSLASQTSKDLIFFCGSKIYNIDFFFRNENVKYLIDSGIDEVKENIEKYYQWFSNELYLSKLFNPDILEEEEYSHTQAEKNLAFFIVLEYCRSINSLDEQIYEEINSLSTNQFQPNKEETAFSNLIKSYTSCKGFYQRFDQKLWHLDYQSVHHMLNCLYQGYKKLPQKHKFINQIVYRGIKFTEIEKKKKILESLKQGKSAQKIFYWNSLSSTSKDIKIAKNFLKDFQQPNSYGVLFVIKLREHPAFVIPTNLTDYENEQEVLLFPQFPFKVVNLTETDEYTQVDIEEDDQSIKLFFKESERKKRWEEIFSQIIIPCLELSIEPNFKRLTFILENYLLIEQSLQNTISMQNLINYELLSSYDQTYKTFSRLSKSISTLQMQDQIMNLFNCFKTQINRSNFDPHKIGMQIEYKKKFLGEQIVQILKKQVFNIEEINYKLQKLDDFKPEIDLSQINFIRYALEFWNKNQNVLNEQILKIQKKISLLNFETWIFNKLENINFKDQKKLNSAIQGFIDIAKNFLEKLKKFDLPKAININQTQTLSSQLISQIISLIMEIIKNDFNPQSIMPQLISVCITTLLVINEIIFKSTLLPVLLIFLSFVALFLEIIKIWKEDGVSIKEKIKKTAFVILKIIAWSLLQLCILFVGMIWGIYAMFLFQIISEITFKIYQYYFEFQLKITQQPQFQQQTQIPQIEIKNIDKKIKNIIITKIFQGQFHWALVKRATFERRKLVIPQGNFGDEHDILYYYPNFQNQIVQQAKYIVYGVKEDTNIDQELLKQFLENQRVLTIIAKCYATD